LLTGFRLRLYFNAREPCAERGYRRAMARSADGTTEQTLKDLAAEEVAAAKERLAVRTAAARRFAAAEAKLAEARAALELSQREATKAKGAAVDEILDSGMKPGDVAKLLGIDAKELRAIRSAAQAHATTKAPGEAATPSDANVTEPPPQAAGVA